MESKYLTFENVSSGTNSTKKTKDFRVWSKNGDHLGFINWRASWRRYVFTCPDHQCSFDFQCLNDIAKMIQELMDERVKKVYNIIKESMTPETRS